MSALRRLLNNLRTLGRRAQHERDLDQELTAYLDAAVQANLARGLSPAEAVRTARAEMGSTAALREQVRDEGWDAIVDRVGRDLRHAWRGVRARGWRGALVVALLGLALAANTVVFSATDSFVLKRLPYPDPATLVEIGEQGPTGWRAWIFPETVLAWQEFGDLFLRSHAYLGGGRAYLADATGPRSIAAASVTPGLLDDLGARPVAGRLFTDQDLEPGAAAVAVVAADLAVQQFGDPRLAVGKTIPVGEGRTIVGVLPAAFRFPSGAERIWTPLNLAQQKPNSLVQSIARLAPGQTIESASAAATSRAANVHSRVSPPWNGRKVVPYVRPLAAGIRDPLLAKLFMLLSAAALCLLLVTCANVINLELAANLSRARVYAVELALGASRGSLVRAAVIEGAVALLLAASVGGGLAVLVTTWLSAALPERITQTLPNGIDIDGRTLVVMAGLATVTWLLTALPIAVVVSRSNVLDILKRDSRTLTASRGARRVRLVLTVGQVAATVMMLVGAMLCARSYASLLAIPKGFDSAGVVGIDIRQVPGDTESREAIHARVLGHLKATEYVSAVSSVGSSPPGSAGAISAPLTIVGRSEPLSVVTLGLYDTDTDYFSKTLRLPLLSGREFQPGDPMSAVIIDAAFAARFWPNGDALGATFKVGSAGWPGVTDGFHVIGIAEHMRTLRDSVSGPSDDFFPVYKQVRLPVLSFVVRLQGDRKVADLTTMVRAIVPNAIVSVRTVRERYAELFGNELLAASVMSAFGGFALLVAMAGVYGVMTFLVAAREREIGIRLAVGADRPSVTRLVLGSSARLIAAGVGVGVLAALIAGRWAESLLFGIEFTDPWTYVVVTGAVLATGLLATWQPARRAARVDPLVALRAE